MNGGPWQSVPEASRRSVSRARPELDQRVLGVNERQLDRGGRRTWPPQADRPRGRPPRSSLEGRSATGWISCCVRDGREPFRARASADIEEAPRLSAENRREAYVPESWCPPVGSPRRYILRKGAKGGVRGTARGKLRFPAWLRRSSAPPRRSSASQQAGAPRRVHPPRALAEGQRVGAWGHQRQSRRRLPTAFEQSARCFRS